MTAQPRQPRLAVLIDGESVSANHARKVFEIVSALGNACVRRVYGDFTNGAHADWLSAAAKHAIQPRLQLIEKPGKNVTDIALAIDAMDLLHAGQMDGFCIASSDRDFTSLAIRIREEGLNVFGLGSSKAVESYRHACQFIPLDQNKVATKISQIDLAIDHNVGLLRNALKMLGSTGEWIHLAALGTKLHELKPGFTYRKEFGVRNLRELVAKDPCVQVEPDTAPARRVRLIGPFKAP